MRSEYDIRGGERGKYYERYMQTMTIRVTFEESTLIARSTAGSPAGASITRAGVYAPAYPSPRIQGIEVAPAA
jgi:hypothetical protein